jgi:L-ascorbate metabolism protein UlaG (beta-lactamase superfamily)
MWHHPAMEITWFGETCIRLKGREGVVAADAYRSVVGPTGRSMTADIVTYSHAEPADAPRAKGSKAPEVSQGLGVIRPTSLEPAFPLDAPGEYEVHEVLVTGVRTYRDEAKGAERGLNTAFVVELDGLHAVHLGDVGHALSEEMLGEIGAVQVACVPVGGALSPAKAAEMVAALDASLVVPMPVGEDPDGALATFLKEMNVTDPQPVAKLTVSISTVPAETTVVVLDSRGKV